MLEFITDGDLRGHYILVHSTLGTGALGSGGCVLGSGGCVLEAISHCSALCPQLRWTWTPPLHQDPH